MKKMMIIDGNSIVNRAFYAIRQLTAPDGLNTNGIYGFLNIMFKNLEAENPDMLAVAFDLKAPTFRHKEYALYKAQRKGMPSELAEQMPFLKDVLNAMNIKIIELEGYEADDIIGTVAEICEKKKVLCKIVTGDKDDLQLATENVNILLTTTAKGVTDTVCYDAGKVIERYGITPKQLIDAKGLMGDSSDNIPGVAGIGEKTALSLISEYGSVENVYEHLEDGKIKGALYTKLKEGREMAELSKRLATICLDTPIDLNLGDCERAPVNESELAEILTRLDLKTFIKKLGLDSVKTNEISAEPEPAGQSVIDSIKVLFYTIKEGTVYFSLDRRLYFADPCLMKEVLENKDIKKIGNDIKNDIVFLNSIGIELKGIHFDTAIAAYILDPARASYSVSEISEQYTGNTAQGGAEAVLMEPLYDILSKKIIENGQQDLYNTVELPLIRVLADMQIIGFKIDKKKLQEFSEKLDQDISGLESSIYFQAGETFNINSSKQLGCILFEKMGLPPVKKNKSGYSTDADVMERLKNKHPIIELILDYKHLSKLRSTYTASLIDAADEMKSRIHSSFNQTVTQTGRISSAEPNLQNIPVREDLGRELRRVFVAEEGYTLVDADYSQIELRVLTHISGDKKMADAFINGEDIHTKTASEVFRVPHEMVTPMMRSRAKAVNFGIVYGIGEFSLAQDIGVSRKEAREYIDGYLATYPEIGAYMKRIVEDAKRDGYVTTILNRRRYVPEIKASNFNVRAFGERIAMNAPIQGSAADIIKIAMVTVYNELKERAPESRLILQVHDELIVEAKDSEIETVKEILREQMENAVKLSIPLLVDMNSGKSWYDAK